MIKAAEQRRIAIEIIKIGEYIAWRQPSIANRLRASFRPKDNIIMPANDRDVGYIDSYRNIFWKRLMEEPPMPGRAGGE